MPSKLSSAEVSHPVPRLQGKEKCSMLCPAVSTPINQLVRLDTNGPTEGSVRPLFGFDAGKLAERMTDAGEPAWRGRQLAEALYQQRVTDLEAISTLPKALRKRLTEEGWVVGRPRIVRVFVSNDGTERYLVEGAAGGQTVETVWMPEGDGGEAGDGSDAGDEPLAGTKAWDRATICISSQVGWAVDCHFCLTALL